MPSFERLAVIVSLVGPECSAEFSRRYVANDAAGDGALSGLVTTDIIDSAAPAAISVSNHHRRDASLLRRAVAAGARRSSARIREIPLADVRILYYPF